MITMAAAKKTDWKTEDPGSKEDDLTEQAYSTQRSELTW